MYYTYILVSESKGKLYIGQTNNVQARVLRHNKSKNFSTKNRGPWKLIFSKEFESRSEAMKFEKYLKSLKSKQYILDKIQKNEF
jgi:putative endonuclease